MFNVDHARRRRAYTAGELRADLFVHALGLAIGAIGAVILIWLAAAQRNPPKLAAVGIYAAGLLAMLSASAAYNLAYASRFRALLRRCDHSAIFVMIAGTYTPFTTQSLDGLAAVAVTAGIWFTTVSGIALKWLTPVLFERLGVLFYLVLGWAAFAAVVPLGMILPPLSFSALIAGGALYTIGVIFHLWRSLPFQNAIWHSLVLAAALCHYFSILWGVVLLPVTS